MNLESLKQQVLTDIDELTTLISEESFGEVEESFNKANNYRNVQTCLGILKSIKLLEKDKKVVEEKDVGVEKAIQEAATELESIMNKDEAVPKKKSMLYL